MMTPPRRRALPLVIRLCLLLSLMTCSTGCAVFGLAASALPEPDVPARYTGLKGHSVAIMVWADRGVQIDYPSLRLDLASGVQAKLQQAKKGRKGELAQTTFPHSAASVVRFQEDHPEIQDQPITDVAPRLKVDRLIYVEVQDLRTRSDEAVDLYRGTAVASIKVIAVDPATGKARAAYEESNVEAIFPESAPPEGYPGLGDARTYRGTADQLTTLIAFRFFSHPAK